MKQETSSNVITVEDTPPSPRANRLVMSGRVAKNGLPSRSTFYFHSLARAKSAVPKIVARQGTKATRLAEVLIRLCEAGNQNATTAFRTLVNECRRGDARRGIRAVEDAVHVDLDCGARWVMDRAAELALELLLWLCHYRDNPERCPSRVVTFIAPLPPFDSDTAPRWWRIALLVLLDSYPQLEVSPELLPRKTRRKTVRSRRVMARKPKPTPVKPRRKIIRKIHDRFISFAPPPPGYR